MSLYFYSKANQMVEHEFTDDVAIVRAFSLKSAYAKFKRYYADIQLSDIKKIPFDRKVHILTDY